MKYEPIPLTEEEIKINQAIVEKVLDEVFGKNDLNGQLIINPNLENL